MSLRRTRILSAMSLGLGMGLLGLGMGWSGSLRPAQGMEPAPILLSRGEVRSEDSATTKFAIELHRKIVAGGNREANVFWSPFSVHTALAMIFEGARGDTRQEMANLLGLPSSPASERSTHVPSAWPDRTSGSGVRLAVANGLWVQDDFSMLPEYVDRVGEVYRAGLELLDFSADPEGARRRINLWVEEKTEEKIRDLLAPGTVTNLTRCILTNAIYFKGDWKTPFIPDRTRDRPFSLVDGTSVQVPTMSHTGIYGTFTADGVTGLELEYKGGDLSFVVLVPGPESSLSALEEGLSPARISQWFQRIQKGRVRIRLPKFLLTSNFSLADVLRDAGMKTAFSRSADFSGMTGGRDLAVQNVVHQAYCEVNEAGTEAAAATAGTMEILSISPVVTVDRPFLFLIRDRGRGTIFFLGRVVDPRG